MARRKEDSENWGGSRKGAGRPKEIGSATEQLSVRLDRETAALCKSLGGAKFMREAIRSAVLKSETAALAANRPDPTKLAGFASLNSNRFSLPEEDADARVPVTDMRVACGLPVPALDFEGRTTSLSDLLIRHPATTFLAEATGDSMIDAGICEGDTVIFDRGIEAKNGDIVLALVRGDMTLKRLMFVNGRPELHPENEKAHYPVIRVSRYDDFQVLGVLTGICRRYR